MHYMISLLATEEDLLDAVPVKKIYHRGINDYNRTCHTYSVFAAPVEDPPTVLLGARAVELDLVATIRAPDQWNYNGAATQPRARAR